MKEIGMFKKDEKQIAYETAMDKAMVNGDYEEADKLFDEILREAVIEGHSIKACRNCKHMIKNENYDMFCSLTDPPKEVQRDWDHTDCENDFEPDEWFMGEV